MRQRNVTWKRTLAPNSASARAPHTQAIYFFGKSQLNKLFELVLEAAKLLAGSLAQWLALGKQWVLAEYGQKHTSQCLLCPDLIPTVRTLCSGLSSAPQP